MKALLPLTCLVMLSACGLGETATTAAVGGKSKAAELEQAREVQQKIVSDMDKAQQQARERMEAAESR
jgi:hypothetical protein